MKVRTESEAYDKLEKDISWRKKEIINLKGRLSFSTGYDAITLAKCLVLISYSHWEGFVKNAATIYLTYIKTSATNPSGLSLPIYSSLLAWNISDPSVPMEQKINEVGKIIQRSQKFSFCIEKMCSTESNLSYSVLQKILKSIGISSMEFDTRRNYIDETILGMRNALAHGEQREKLDKNTAIDIAASTIDLMDCFKKEIDNALSLKKWQK